MEFNHVKFRSCELLCKCECVNRKKNKLDMSKMKTAKWKNKN